MMYEKNKFVATHIFNNIRYCLACVDKVHIHRYLINKTNSSVTTLYEYKIPFRILATPIDIAMVFSSGYDPVFDVMYSCLLKNDKQYQHSIRYSNVTDSYMVNMCFKKNQSKIISQAQECSLETKEESISHMLAQMVNVIINSRAPMCLYMTNLIAGQICQYLITDALPYLQNKYGNDFKYASETKTTLQRCFAFLDYNPNQTHNNIVQHVECDTQSINTKIQVD